MAVMTVMVMTAVVIIVTVMTAMFFAIFAAGLVLRVAGELPIGVFAAVAVTCRQVFCRGVILVGKIERIVSCVFVVVHIISGIGTLFGCGVTYEFAADQVSVVIVGHAGAEDQESVIITKLDAFSHILREGGGVEDGVEKFGPLLRIIEVKVVHYVAVVVFEGRYDLIIEDVPRSVDDHIAVFIEKGLVLKIV